MSNKVSLIFSFLYFFCITIFANPLPKNAKGSDAFFTFHVNGKLPSDHYRIYTNFHRDFIGTGNADENEDTNSSDISFIQEPDGKFRVKFYGIDHPARLTIAIRKDSSREAVQIGADYWVEGGDRIIININEVDSNSYKATFSGNRAEKYICSYLLGKYRDNIWNIFFPERLPTDTDADYVPKIFPSFVKYKKVCSQLLFKYKKLISPDVYFLMETEINAYSDLNWVATLNDWYEFDTRKLKIFYNIPKIEKLYYDNRPVVDTTKSYLLSLSKTWIEFAWANLLTNLILENKRLPSYQESFEAVKRQFTGRIREKVWGLILLDSRYIYFLASNSQKQNNDDLTVCFDSASFYAQTPSIKSFFVKHTLIRQGKPAYNFHFKNKEGQTISLSDFKGKTVLIDMWYTGCGGCAQFYKAYEDSLARTFDKDTSFVFISVGTDTSYAKWIRSIQSGLYSNEKHVNVTTGSMGSHDDFQNYYSVGGYPFILLVDKYGKIVTNINSWRPAPLRKLIKDAMAD